MGLRSLIFEDGSDDKKVTKDSKQSFGSKFPSDSRKQSVTNSDSGTGLFSFPSGGKSTKKNSKNFSKTQSLSCEPYINDVMDMYEKGFDNLNQEGYDFYEYFKTVAKGGIDNEAVYAMAFTMGQAMDSGIDKRTLLDQAEFYINKLNEVHDNFSEQGENRKRDIITSKETQESHLRDEVNELKREIDRLNSLKNQKDQELSRIDNEFSPEISEIDCKLQANDIAKDKLIEKIDQVVGGIKSHV
tara:strand:+ start:5833 stop:6561 length:729 start_codon:yes stop_codon:yes gene_type:complete